MGKQHYEEPQNTPRKMGVFITGSLPSWGTFIALMTIYTSIIRWQDKIDSALLEVRKDVDKLIVDYASQEKRTAVLESRAGVSNHQPRETKD